MNGYRLYRHLAISLVVAGGLLLLTGCQGLTGGSNGAGTVGVGTGNLDFGTVTIGSSQTLTDTLSNHTSSPVTISSIQGLGPGFEVSGITLPVVLAAGQSTPFSVQFQPTDPGNPTTTISFNGQNAQPYASLIASGRAVTIGKLSSSPSQIAFGNIKVGANQTSTVTLSNSGGTDLTITQSTLSGAGFSMSNLTLPLTLHAGNAASVTITFLPTGSGNFNGSVTFATSADKKVGNGNQVNSNVVLTISGYGVTLGALFPNPSSLALGSIQMGSSNSQSETLTNVGGSTVTISQATTSGAGFSVSGLTLPITLNAGQSTTFNAIFTPSATGAASGTLTINSNASNATLSIPLSATGVAQGQLGSNPSSFSFGNIQVGTSKSLTDTLTNTGGTSLTISAATASGAGFSLSGLSLPLTLSAGQSTSFTVLFSPTASGAASGSVGITSTGSDSNLSIPLSGTGVAPGALAANPTTLAFGSVQVGNSSNLSETLTNTGGSTVTISQANLTGSVFSISGLSLPLNLAANQSVTFTATFTPTSGGAASGNLSVVSTAFNSPLNIALSGTGTAAGQLAVSPTSLSFGNVVDGSSSSLSGSLKASGASVTITGAGLNNGEFMLSGISLPVTLTAGQSTPFTVTFTPQASGATSASLSFSSNAANSPTVQSMTGTGTTPVQQTVDLSWNASADAAGYNVYRGTVSGGPYTMINASLDGTTAYTDNTVASGQTYYYVTTAVNSQGQESGYSNQTTAVVPNQ